ncbi:hypothetical protein F5Y13DRAFT_172318 [Hypoxylon sp. FL1857]|nr:hypothetical protein F5Y13DRAFT_172318 [Hypoxylon sp. FL1857]
MLFLYLFLTFLVSLVPAQPVQGEAAPAELVARKAPLVDFNAARRDDPKKLGTLNLEKGKGDKPKSNTPDLYVKLDEDFKGVNGAARFHHRAGYRRAEYHSLKGQTKAGTTYFITYKFALGELPDGLIVFQWKEYKANNAKDGGANIPLALEVRNNKLAFSHTFKWGEGRKVQWSQDIKAKTEYKVGLEISAKAKGGYAKLWLNGKPVTFDTTKSQTLTGNMYPGQSDPKFGIYGGETVTVDSYVYQVQIGTSKNDVDQSYFGN